MGIEIGHSFTDAGPLKYIFTYM